MRLSLILMMLLVSGCGSSSPDSTVIGSLSEGAEQALRVVVGPTPIPSGDALGANDITVSNKFFALSFAVDTASPWGVARGGILDIEIFREGQLERDFVSLVDFMPNYWSAWPTSYQRVEVLQESLEEVVVRSQRDWGEVTLETTFTIGADSNLVRINTTMTNSSAQPISDLTSGYIAWPNGGQLFGMPGITEGDSTPVSEQPALAKWSASYDADWALGLHTPFSELIAYTGRDRYLKHNLGAGETREFEAWLQIEDNADLAHFVKAEINMAGMPAGSVSGTVKDAQGQAIANSAVMVRQNQQLYAWSLVDQGDFAMVLPVGEYQLYAAAAGYAPGKQRSITISEDQHVNLAFNDVQPPATIKFSIQEKNKKTALDAMISIIEGTKPEIKYHGKSRFFTELSNPGFAELTIAPGDYQFDISAAGSFTSKVAQLDLTAESGQVLEIQHAVDVLANPAEQNWYSADMHHHSDVLDGFTPPEHVLRSQLAAGVDVAFLSDHDSTQNNAEMAKLAAKRAMVFVPGTELSASWGHFNAYPIAADKTVNPDVGLFSVQQIFSEARRLGAEIIHVNHPFGNYGYFDSLKNELKGGAGEGSIVPGGYDDGFDLIEITTEHTPETLARAWQLWNQHKPAYFAAGSDVHDVWSTLPEHSSGAARSYVYVDTELSVDSYIAALKAGHSYASQGPLIYPELMFGSTIKRTAGESFDLTYNIQSVVGLASVELIEQGEMRESRQFDSVASAGIDQRDISFVVQAEKNTWYSLVVVDVAGNYAYSNPLWVTVADGPEEKPKKSN